MQSSLSNTFSPRMKLPGGNFTYYNGTPVFIHDDGVWDFARGESMEVLWRTAQGIQRKVDTEKENSLLKYIQKLQKENRMLASQGREMKREIDHLKYQNTQLRDEVDMLKRISVFGIFPGEGMLIRVIKPEAVRPYIERLENSEVSTHLPQS